jgi:hypothetical protein
VEKPYWIAARAAAVLALVLGAWLSLAGRVDTGTTVHPAAGSPAEIVSQAVHHLLHGGWAAWTVHLGAGHE